MSAALRPGRRHLETRKEHGLRWLERLAEPWMVRPHSPTADLYFLNACADWVGSEGPIRQHGPGVFASRDTTLVIRHMGGARKIPRRQRLLYLIDDDVSAAVRGWDLSYGQRFKLWLFEHRHGHALTSRGAEAVVSSPALRQMLSNSSRRTHVLTPHWSEPLGWPRADTAPPIRLAYLSSAAHRRDTSFILPVLRQVLDARPNAELHIAANHRLADLRSHPRVHPIEATDWPGYRRWLASTRLDIAVYPLLPSAVNRARSVNKLIEHAVAGAATLCSKHWPEAERVRRRRAGLVLPDDPAEWARALLDLIDTPSRIRDLALAGRRLAVDLNRPDRQRRFWYHAFSLQDRDICL